MQFESLKHNLCVAFAGIVNDDMLKNNRVFFVTPAGVISGFIASPKEGEVVDPGENAYRTVLYETHKLLKQDIDTHKSKIRAPHDGCLLLRDVEIHPLNQPLSAPIIARMRNCVLFTSYVVAVFLADVSQSNFEAVQQ